MSPYDYHRPQTLYEAFELKKSDPNSLYISGGTDLLVRIKKKESNPHSLISLRSIPDLHGVKKKDFLQIGAMNTISEILKNRELGKQYPILLEAANSLGSVQIRNVATIGGNLCNGSPAADMAPPLLVLGAKVRLIIGKKSRDVPVEDFFLGPGKTFLDSEEILTDVLLDAPEPDTKTAFLKIGRVKMDLALASAAVLLRTDGDIILKARLAAGSVAPRPLRLHRVESLLEGARISPKLLLEAQKTASETVSPISDIRATKTYRQHLVGILVRRAMERLMEWSET
jgi:CO/xanthine dehydrogenase FAD-binding subunit